MTKLEDFDRIIGMDLSKRTYKACVLTRERNFEDRKVLSGRMDASGRQNFISTLGPKDIVAIEGGTSSNNFARELEEKAGMVFLLNPGKLHIIFQSQRKTDKFPSVTLTTVDTSAVGLFAPAPVVKYFSLNSGRLGRDTFVPSIATTI